MADTLTIACLQTDPVLGDVAANLGTPAVDGR